MKLKSFIFASLVFCISTFLFSSCTKTETIAAPVNPIVGLWIGTQVAGDGSSTILFIIALISNPIVLYWFRVKVVTATPITPTAPGHYPVRLFSKYNYF